MKQTATEYLFEKLWNEPKDKLTWHSILEQAKEMEKKQIIDACDVGFDDGCGFIEDIKYNNAEQYYKETYE
jgi:isoleucyl-tRNA synthetase